jgi:transposase
MEYFAGLGVSMEETHVCVVDRDGKIILEARTPTAPKTIAAALAKGPPVERACRWSASRAAKLTRR